MDITTYALCQKTISTLNDKVNTFLNSDDKNLDELKEIVDYIKNNKQLIQNITKDKVNVTDIVNDLTTDAANKPLSAAQGVKLKELIDQINAIAVINPDWNQNNETQPDFIKNKICYEKDITKTSIDTITWNEESFDEKITFEGFMGEIFVLVHETPIPKNILKDPNLTGTIKTIENSTHLEEQSFTAKDTDINAEGCGWIGSGRYRKVLNVPHDKSSLMSFIGTARAPKAGIYFQTDSNNRYYVTSIKINGYSFNKETKTLKTIDPKFIPSAINESATASGEDSHAEGYNTIASGPLGSHAEGASTTASGGIGSHAEGYNTIASGNDGSHAEGNSTTASDRSSHAEGCSTIASGYSSHAEGSSTTASDTCSHAEGSLTKASGFSSHAEGRETEASGNSSHAEGNHTIASGYNSHASGSYNDPGTTEKPFLFSVGNGTYDTERKNAMDLDYEGNFRTAKSIETGDVILRDSTAGSDKKFHVTVNNKGELQGITIPGASDPKVVSDWNQNDGTQPDYIKNKPNIHKGLGEDSEVFNGLPPKNASGINSHAEGKYTKASGDYSHAEGYNTTASGGIGSHAEGYTTTASSNYGSHAEGYQTNASGEGGCHAEGSSTTASGACSHAEGNRTIASGDGGSHAEGSDTTASGDGGSHAEGNSTTASGSNSHSEGYGTTAKGQSCHAEGDQTTAEIHASHAEGYNTKALQHASHAEGDGTTANGACSHAEGYCTKATGDISHASGKYNDPGTTEKPYLFSVGNGTSDTDRKNAMDLDYEGNLQLGKGLIIKSAGGKKFRLIVDDNGALSTEPVTEPTA